MTRDEAKALLASKANKLAGQAIELIRRNGPVDRLRALIEEGCADTYWTRDPAHPRSRLCTAHILAVCYDDPTRPLVPVTRTDGVLTVTLGDQGAISDVENLAQRLALFRVCLENGFKGGENGWRGGLENHILKNCFYAHSDNAREATMAFAKVLIEVKKLDIAAWAAHHYEWHGTPQKLSRLIELGAPPSSSGLLDNCVQYIGCSPSSGETYESRIEVIKILLAAGAMVKAEIFEKSVLSGAGHNYERLKTFKLLEAIAAAIDPKSDPSSPLLHPEGLEAWLNAAALMLTLKATSNKDWPRIRAIEAALRARDITAVQSTCLQTA